MKGIASGQLILPLPAYLSFSSSSSSCSPHPQERSHRRPKVPEHPPSRLPSAPAAAWWDKKTTCPLPPLYPLLLPRFLRKKKTEVTKDRERKSERDSLNIAGIGADFYQIVRTSSSHVGESHAICDKIVFFLRSRLKVVRRQHSHTNAERASESWWKRFVRSPS